MLRPQAREAGMWLRKVRRANISKDLRTRFERFGEDVLAHALAVGSILTQGRELLNLIEGHREEVMEWLTERRDNHERREQRLETAEWAILIWVVVGVIADIIIVMR
jgi:ferric-dicitrate binding protein FerR (iron transport regulator)